MTDSWGDGWNGNVLTLESGSGYTWNFVGPTNNFEGTNENIAIGEPSQCGIYFGCTDEQADNYDEINNIDDGSCTYSCLDGGTAVTISCDGGSWQSEVSWSISGFSGSVGSTEACLEDGCLTFTMLDSYGDGWNGNVVTITSEAGDVLITGTLDSGSEGTLSFGLNFDGDCGPVYG